MKSTIAFFFRRIQALHTVPITLSQFGFRSSSALRPAPLRSRRIFGHGRPPNLHACLGHRVLSGVSLHVQAAAQGARQPGRRRLCTSLRLHKANQSPTETPQKQVVLYSLRNCQLWGSGVGRKQAQLRHSCRSLDDSRYRRMLCFFPFSSQAHRPLRGQRQAKSPQYISPDRSKISDGSGI